MMTYEKAKRKNDDFRPALWESVANSGVSAARFAWYFGVMLPAKGAWWLTKNSALGTWWLTKNLASGSWQATRAAFSYGWLATQATAFYAWQGTVWMVTAPFRLLRWLFIEPLPEFDNPRQAQAYKLVRRYYRRRRWLMTHAFIYAGIMSVGLIQFFWLLRRQVEIGQSLSSALGSTFAFMMFFTVLMAFHFMRVRMGNAEDEALADVLDRDYGRSARKPHLPDEYEYHGRLDDDYADDADENAGDYYEEEQHHRNNR